MTTFRRVAGAPAYVISGLVVLVTTAWAVLAIYYSNLPGDALRTIAAAVFAVAVLLLFVLVPPWRRAVAIYLVGFSALVAWWLTIPPSNNRDWQPDVALLPIRSR